MRLIDADAFIAELTIDPIECPGCPEPEFLDEFLALVASAPTADAVPVVHGTWKTVEDWDGDEHYECSVCGEEWFLEAGDPKSNNMNYCPHCGARMDGDENEAY